MTSTRIGRWLAPTVAAALAVTSTIVAPTPALAATAAPAVSSVSPTAGPATGGATVTITGARFTHVTKVVFGASAGTRVHVVSSTQLTVIAPAHTAGAVDVRVSTKPAKTTLTSAKTSKDHYTYMAAPVVTAVSPAAGALAGRTAVTITGTGFSRISKVSFGTTAGTSLKVVSATRLTVLSPAHATGVVDVRVVGSYGTSKATTKDRFTYTAAPAVTGIGPASGPAAGGGTVTVTGTGFTRIGAVTFGTTAGTTVTVASSTRLTVTPPAHTAGVVDVRVTGAYGTSPATTADRYNYLDTTPPPPVTGLTVTATTSDTITLSWTDPTSTNYAGVTIRRATGTTPPATPTSGTAVTELPAPGHTYTDTGLTAATTYSYAVFAHDTTGNHAAAASVTGTTAAPTSCTPAVVHVSGQIAANTTWKPDCASAFVIDGQVSVPNGVTLTIAPGTVVKSTSGSSLSIAGSLTVSGTSAAPVVLTSVNDGSVGGSTGPDSPTAGDWGGVSGSAGSSISIAHAVVAYAGVSVEGGALSMTSTLVEDAATGVSVQDTTTAPTISNDTFTHVGSNSQVPGYQFNVEAVSAAISISNSSVNLGLLGGDTGSGGEPAIEFSDHSVVTVSSSQAFTGLPVILGCTRADVYGPGSLDVPAGVTATFGAGSVIKGAQMDSCQISDLAVDGTLNLTGTASNPVVLTSVNDGSVGGSTGPDSPTAGDWGGVTIEPSASATLDNVDVEYASTSITMNGSTLAFTGAVNHVDAVLSASSGSSSLRGRFADYATGVTSCSWQSASCTVDAAYTDWGHGSAGPFPTSGAVVCGAVIVSPWTGESGSQSTPFGSQDCGGPTPSPDAQLGQASTQASSDEAGWQALCGDPNFADACQVAQSYNNCLSGAWTLATSNSPVPLDEDQAKGQAEDYVGGKLSDWLIQNGSAAAHDVGEVASYSLDILKIVNIFTSLDSAYSRCDPGPAPSH